MGRRGGSRLVVIPSESKHGFNITEITKYNRCLKINLLRSVSVPRLAKVGWPFKAYHKTWHIVVRSRQNMRKVFNRLRNFGSTYGRTNGNRLGMSIKHNLLVMC